MAGGAILRHLVEGDLEAFEVLRLWQRLPRPRPSCIWPARPTKPALSSQIFGEAVVSAPLSEPAGNSVAASIFCASSFRCLSAAITASSIEWLFAFDDGCDAADGLALILHDRLAVLDRIGIARMPTRLRWQAKAPQQRKSVCSWSVSQLLWLKMVWLQGFPAGTLD